MSAPARGPARARAGRWSAAGWCVVEDGDRPFLTRGLRVPGPGRGPPARRRRARPDAGRGDRGGRPVRRTAGRAARSGPAVRGPDGAPPGEGARHRSRRGRGRPGRRRARGAGPGSAPGAQPSRRWTCSGSRVREALLRGAGLVAGPIEVLAEGAPDAVHLLARSGVPLLLVGSTHLGPQVVDDDATGRRRPGAEPHASGSACGSASWVATSRRSTPRRSPGTWRWGRPRCATPSGRRRRRPG